MRNSFSTGVCLLLAAGLPPLIVSRGSLAFADEVVPTPRLEITSEFAPASLSQLFSAMQSGNRKQISLPGATWIQLQFSKPQLGVDDYLQIEDSTGEIIRLSDSQIESWDGHTPRFKGSVLNITLSSPEEDLSTGSIAIRKIIIGIGSSSLSDGVLPKGLQKMLGPDSSKLLPQGQKLNPRINPESICDASDNRVTSSNRGVGRLMDIGCTAYIVWGDRMITAGHCDRPGATLVEFNVPPSDTTGTTQPAAVDDQYFVVPDSFVSQETTDNDWAVFRVRPNQITGLFPAEAQGTLIPLSRRSQPNNVTITGYGVDGPSPNFGSSGPRNADSQTQQTGTGPANYPNNIRIEYRTDTQPANSGSPILQQATNTSIGVHFSGGCGTRGGRNAGTSFRSAAFWNAIGDSTHGTQTVAKIISYQRGVVTAFSGKGIYLSPDGRSIGGGGLTTRA
ncbi:serine protease [Cyanobium sp. NS01]|uniref:trypsin-like serine peptidase n=1 Tax=Cyanobium sp. NS01 TaxID=261284 RepID=UPI0016491F17|nr:trypsin-like serine protease [Cyanobium sp. NS01]QNI71046.1 trypsin family protein [Cyanobium sp. NS01]